MNSYQEAWLSAHPNRSAEWLRARLADGFHVHHLDGDHSNDTPGNLVLIEGDDHWRLHGLAFSLVLPLVQVGQGKALAGAKRAALDRACYEGRRLGKLWRVVAEELRIMSKDGCRIEPGNAAQAARRHAERHSLKWPPL